MNASASDSDRSHEIRSRWRRIGDDPAEIDVLERAILGRLREAGVLQQADEDFVHYRFANQLRNYWSWNGLYAFAFVVVTIGVLVTSLASSSIAAGWSHHDWARWTILALGLVGGVASLINWAWRPGDKGTSRTRGRNALRREGWAFVERRGRYLEVEDVRAAFGVFVDEVENIAQTTSAVDEAGPVGPPPIGGT